MFYDEKDVCINSVIASEHAIMCSLTGFFIKTKDGSWDKIGNFEVETFRYLLKTFPTGILSLVSDTWDLWRVITEYCQILKEEILARDGKLVIRPDSGDPVDIICGDNSNDKSPQSKGVIELLWDIFGGTTTSTGYKKLDSHIGAIYGDSINYKRAESIYERLSSKGFATTNIVLGVGSFSLQMVTRDTHGMAQKATYIEIDVNGDVEGINIFKDPITDDGTKKSATGLIKVIKSDGEFILKDKCTWDEVNSDDNELKVIFKDGKFYNETTLTIIRGKLEELVSNDQVELV
jgi:nicotinamide phosphoribosyltransferase